MNSIHASHPSSQFELGNNSASFGPHEMRVPLNYLLDAPEFRSSVYQPPPPQQQQQQQQPTFITQISPTNAQEVFLTPSLYEISIPTATLSTTTLTNSLSSLQSSIPAQPTQYMITTTTGGGLGATPISWNYVPVSTAQVPQQMTHFVFATTTHPASSPPQAQTQPYFQIHPQPIQQIVVAKAEEITEGIDLSITAPITTTKSKKRVRSACIAELTYLKQLDDETGKYSRIRVWTNTSNMVFYDCDCGKRKPLKDLKKIKRHVDGHSISERKCEFCGRSFAHHLQLNAHMKVHKFELDSPPDANMDENVNVNSEDNEN